MRRKNVQVGMRVRVVRERKAAPHGRTGQTGTVVAVRGGLWPVGVAFEDSREVWWFEARELEPVEVQA